MRDTFEQAGLLALYSAHYTQLCALVHPSAYALSYGFQDELWSAASALLASERKQASWVVDALIRALGVQLMAAKELVGVTPKSGMPDFEALLKQLRETK